MAECSLRIGAIWPDHRTAAGAGSIDRETVLAGHRQLASVGNDDDYNDGADRGRQPRLRRHRVQFHRQHYRQHRQRRHQFIFELPALNADQLHSELWCKARAAAVPLGATITVTYSGAPTGGGAVAAIAVQVAGLNNGAVDKTASASGTSTTVTASTAALSQVNEILFGVASQNGTTSYTTRRRISRL